jgi:hypothetical protein
MGRKRIRRKTKRNQVKVPFPLFVGNVVVVTLVLALSYMWVCARCDAYGREIKLQESELEAARKRLRNEVALWSAQTSPQNMARALLRHGLAMEIARDDQTVFVSYQGARSDSQVAYRF